MSTGLKRRDHSDGEGRSDVALGAVLFQVREQNYIHVALRFHPGCCERALVAAEQTSRCCSL